MQIAPDSLLFVFADLDDLFFESLSVFEQCNTRVRSALLLAHGDAGEADEEEKSKSNGDFPRLDGPIRIRVPQHKVSPRPENAC